MKQINCKNCGHKINVEQALYDNLRETFEDKVDKEVQDKITESNSILNAQIDSLTKIMKSSVKEAGDTKADNLLLQSKLDNATVSAKIELEQEYNEKIQDTIQSETIKIQEQAKLKVTEKQDIIQQLQKQLSIAQQKAAHSDNRRQGEAMEIVIEEYLMKTFPTDTLTEVRKGAAGADSKLEVNTISKQNIGSILIESKNTIRFNKEWIDKLKKDQIEAKADIGVIVTKTLPVGVKSGGVINGVWVVTLMEFKIVVKSLRESILSVDKIQHMQENKDQKMESLYSYITSKEFELQISSIIDGFSKMQTELEAEKRSMQILWKRRSVMIDKVLNGTVGMYGSMSALSTEVPNVKSLEL